MSDVSVNLTGLNGILPIENGGTNSDTALSGSSIMVSDGTSIIQGDAGTTTTVLHGNASGAPSYGAVSLSADCTGTLSVANGGTGQTSYTDGQLLIGNSSGNTLTKATLTAGSGISITNGNGSIEIEATGSSAPTTTEYTSPSGNPYTYNIPAGSKYLDLILIGAGGSGGGGSSSATNPGGGGGGGAGMTRFLRVPVESGVTTCTVTVGTGGAASASGANGSAGTQTTLVINSKTIYAAAGGGGSNGGSGRSGGGGGSGGAANGGSSSSNSFAGVAGSATPPANTHYTIGVAGIAGSNGQTSGGSVAPSSPGVLTTNLYCIGGSGTGPSSYQGASAVGGDCQGAIFQTPATIGFHDAGTGCTGGGNGGSSWKALGGRGAYFASFARTDATAGSYGSGGAGGLGSNIGQVSGGSAGGDGYCSITPVY